MEDNTVEFLEYLFTQLTGSIFTSDGELWTKKYASQCEQLLKNISDEVYVLRKIYSHVTVRDIEKIIFTEVIDITANINTANMETVAIKYMELFMGYTHYTNNDFSNNFKGVLYEFYE